MKAFWIMLAISAIAAVLFYVNFNYSDNWELLCVWGALGAINMVVYYQWRGKSWAKWPQVILAALIWTSTILVEPLYGTVLFITSTAIMFHPLCWMQMKRWWRGQEIDYSDLYSYITKD